MALHRANRQRTKPTRRAGIIAASVAAALAATAVASVSAANAAGPTVIAKDSFQRTAASGWGSAEVGGAYDIWSTAGTSARLDAGTGEISALKPGGSFRASLPRTSAADVDFTGSLTLPNPLPAKLGLYHAWELRGQKDGSAYRGRVEVDSRGQVVLSISRVNRNAETNLTRSVVPVTATAGGTLNAEFRITGTSTVSISGRIWQKGSTQPVWQTTASDSSSARIATAGTVGVWDYLARGTASPVALRIDDITATAASATATPTAPATTTPTPTATPTVTPSATPTATPTPAPSTPATPTTPPSSDSGRGSAPVGSTAYPVPANSLFVDGSSGSDSAAGTQAAPLRTLATAVSHANAGQTVVLRAGTYNESVTVGKAITIQAYPHEAVWLDGTIPVTAWNGSGSTWVSSGWKASFTSTMDGVADNPRFVSSAQPLASHPDQVFYDGKQLKQVQPGQVGSGTFAVDPTSKQLILGGNPAGHSIRASNLAQAIYTTSPGVTLQGFGVRGYATPYDDQKGAVRLGNKDETARDLTIVDNAMIGMNVENDNASIDHVTVQRSGLLGIGVNESYGLSIRNSIVTDNDTQLFKPEPVSGGIKITRSRGVTVSNNDTSRNQTHGIWCDESCYNVTIANNTSNDNGVTSIEVELSDTGVIAGNEAVGQQIGILVYNSGDFKVFNNTLGTNSLFSLKLAQDERRQATASFAGHDPRQPIPDPTVTWLTHNITVSNNAFGNGGLYQFYALDGVTNIPVDAMKVTITGNLFNAKATSSDPTLVGWGQGDNVTLQKFQTPAALAAAKNSSWVNAVTPSSQSVSAMGTAMSSSASVAVPLPSDVAAAVGQPAGTRHIGTF